MNKADLDKMFNLQVMKPDAALTDSVSKQYLEKISSLREQQKALLPLFLQSQRVVARHKRCLKVILTENEENIPYQLQRVIDKGQEGLNGYGKLLDNIQNVLTKNQALTEQLQKYQENINEVSAKTMQTEASIHELRGDVTQQALVVNRIEQSKDKINNMLSGLMDKD